MSAISGDSIAGKLNQDVTKLLDSGAYQITDLFLAVTKDSVRLVPKRSLRGRWLAFSTYRARRSSKPKEAKLDLDRALQEAKNASLSLKPQTAAYLERLKMHVQAKRRSKDPKLTKIHLGAMQAIDDLSTLFDISDFTQWAKESLPDAAFSDAQKEQLIAALNGRSEAKTILLAAREGSFLPLILFIQKECRDLEPCLTNLPMPADPPSLPPEPWKHFGNILGDAFLEESGLEGDFTPTGYQQLITQFMDQYKQEEPRYQQMKTAFTGAIDLRFASLDETAIKAQLQKEGRCLLLGGWKGHAMLYEMIRQRNGRYTFRVYNQGAGIEYHPRQKEPFRDKFAPSVGVCDVKADRLFNSGFLPSLKALNQHEGESSPGLLYAHFLTSLQGKAEKRQPMRFVLPQRSGTCLYRSFHAYVSSCLPEMEAKAWHFHFRLYILKRYLPLVQSVQEPVDDTSYQELRRNRSLIDRSIEKLAKTIEKPTMPLSKEDLQQAFSLIAAYKAEIARVDAALLHYEKALRQVISEGLDLPPASLMTEPVNQLSRLNAPARARSLPARVDHSPELAAYQLLEGRPLPIEAILDYIHSSECQEKVWWTDQLFRRFDSIKEWQQVKFQDPTKAYEQLYQLTLVKGLPLEMFIFARLGMEEAFLQTPEGKYLARPTLSVLDSPELKKALAKTHLVDPQWRHFCQEMRAPSARPPLHTLDESFYQDPTVISVFQNWWQAEAQKGLRERITAQVQEEQKEQQGRIKQEKERLEKEIKSLRESKKELEGKKTEVDKQIEKITKDKGSSIAENQAKMAAVEMLLKELQENLKRTSSQQRQAEEALASCELRIRGEQKYWPIPFAEAVFTLKEKPSDEKALQAMTAFFLTEQVQRPMRQQSIKEIFENHRCVYPLAIEKLTQHLFLTALAQNFYLAIVLGPINALSGGSLQERISDKIDWKQPESDRMQSDFYVASGLGKETAFFEWLGGRRKESETDHFEGRWSESGWKIHTSQFRPLWTGSPHFELREWLLSARSQGLTDIEGLLQFFEAHSDLLDNPNWVMLFHRFLLDNDNALSTALKSPTGPLLARQLHSFFATQIQCAHESENMLRAARLCWLGTILHSTVKQAGLRDEVIRPDQITDCLKGIAVDKKGQKKGATPYILACYAYRDAFPPQALLAPAYAAKLIFSDVLSDDHCLARDVHSAWQLLKKDFLTDRAQFLATLAGSTLLETLFPDLSLKELRLHPSNPDIVVNDQDDWLLVLEATWDLAAERVVAAESVPIDQSWKDFFVRHQLATPEQSEFLTLQREGGHYYLKDAKRQLTFKWAVSDSNLSSLFIKKEGRWHLYCEPSMQMVRRSDGPIDAVEVELQRRYRALLYRDEQGREAIDFCDPNSFATVYTKQGDGKTVDRSGRVLAVPQAPLEFDQLSHTWYWEKEGHLERIDFPRYQVALIKKEGKWHLEEDEEWFLSQDQTIPRLAAHVGALVFENRAGKKEVYLPMRALSTASSQALALPFTVVEDQELQHPVARYRLEEGQLVPKNLEGRYFLCYLYLSLAAVDEAEKLLDTHFSQVTSRSLQKEEEHWLQEIVWKLPSKSQEARVIKLRLHAWYLLIVQKNQEELKGVNTLEENKELEKILELKEIWELYTLYLKKLAEMTPLPATEELFLLKHFPHRPSAAYLRQSLLERDVLEVAPAPRKAPEGRRLRFDRDDPLDLTPKTRWQRFKYYCKGIEYHSEALQEAITSPLPVDETLKKYLIEVIEPQIKYSRLGAIYKSQIPMQLYHLACFHSDQGVQTLAKHILDYWFARSQSVQTLPAPSVTDYPVLPSSPQERLKEQVRTFAITLPPVTDTLPVEAFLSKREEVQEPASSMTVTHADLRVATAMQELTQTIASLPPETKWEAKEGAQTAIEDALRIANERLKEQETLLNQTLGLLFEEPMMAAQVAAHERQIPTLQELALLVTKQDGGATLRALYPEIKESDSLKEAILTWMVQKTEVQHLERAKENPVLMATPRAHENEAYFLLLEMICDVRLRPEQVATIREFVQGLEKGESIVASLIMGSGKTALIQPLLSFLFAQEGKLSTVTVPPALYPTLRDQLFERLGTTFGQYLFAIPVSRAQTQDVQFLRYYHAQLQRISRLRGCLINTPMHKYTLLSALYSAYRDKARGVETPHLDARIQLLVEINRHFLFSSTEQLEEIDLLADSQTIFRSVCGQATPLDTDRGLLAIQLFEAMSGDEVIYNAVDIEPLRLFRKRAGQEVKEKLPPLTEESFRSIVRPRLIEHAARLLNVEKGVMERFIDDPKNPDHWPEERMRESFGVVASMIEILAAATEKVYCCEYGFDAKEKIAGDRYVARPYAAANTPKTTRYLDPYEQLTYSLLTLFAEGVPIESAAQWLAELRTKTKKGLASGIPLKETEGYQTLCRIWPEPPVGLLKEPHETTFIEEFHKRMSASIEGLNWHATHKMLPQIVYYKENVTLTPQTLMRLNEQRVGYSATPSKATLAVGMRVIGATDTEARIIQSVNDKIALGTSRIDSVEDNALDYLNRQLQDPALHMIIDSGGWLKEVKDIQHFLPQLELREELAGVIFHDKNQQLMVWKKGDHTVEAFDPLKHQPERGGYLTLLEELYETGTNVLQPPEAKAVMTVRKGMQLRDAAQSLLRMRQLRQGQNVIIAIHKDVRAHMHCEEVTADQFWLYLVSNQVESKGEKSWLAADQRLKETFSGILLRRLLVEKDPHKQLEIFKLLEPLVIQQVEDDPFKKVTAREPLRPKEEAVEGLLSKYRKEKERVESEGGAFGLPAISEEELKACIHKAELPDQLRSAADPLGGEVEMEVEHQVEQQVEQQVAVEQVQLIDAALANASNLIYTPIVTQLCQGELTSLAPLPGVSAPSSFQDVYASPNLCLSLIPSGTYPQHHLPTFYFARITTQQPPRYVLLSFQDLKELKALPSLPKTLDVFSFNGRVVLSHSLASASALEDNPDFWQGLCPVITYVKLLTGWASFSRAELAEVPKLVAADPALVPHYETLVKALPGVYAQYAASPLFTLFHPRSPSE